MKFWREARVLGVLTIALMGISCGDQYRPVAVPIIPPPPDPAALHFVLVLSDNGGGDPGASSRVDVSGDTNVAVAQLGLRPAHATLTSNAGRVYVANTSEDSVSSYAPGTTTTTGIPVTTTSLPILSRPVFITTTETATVYVANFGTNSVAAISTTTNVVLNPQIPVGTHPVALAETPDQKKLYSVNLDSGDVTAINVVDRSVSQTIATGTMPVLALARSDSARVYVLNSGSGTVSAIDTSTDTLLTSVPVGAGANYMVYDKNLNRLYITNPVANTLTALNVASDPPAVLYVTPVPSSPFTVAVLPNSGRVYVVTSRKLPPCTTDPSDVQPCISASVTVINTTNGSITRTVPLESTVNIKSATQNGPNENFNFSTTTYNYNLISGPTLRAGMKIVVAGMADAGNNGTFTVVSANAASFTVANGAGTTASGQSGIGAVVVEIFTTNPTGCDINGLGVPSGAFGGVRFRLSSAASADSTRVYVGKCDSGSTTIIQTSNDTPVIDMPAPLSVLTPPNGGNALPQNPVFILAGP